MMAVAKNVDEGVHVALGGKVDAGADVAEGGVDVRGVVRAEPEREGEGGGDQ